MFLFATDESNFLDNNQGDYLVYGGVIASEGKLKNIADGLRAIKAEHGLKANDEIKWKPELELSGDRKVAIKKAVIELSTEEKLKLIVYVVPHAISRSKSVFENFQFAFNISLQQFERFLEERDGVGMILADDISTIVTKGDRPKVRDFLLNVFNAGTTGKIELKRVAYPIIFVQSHMSPLHQIGDVLIGSVRFAVNQFANKNSERERGLATALGKQVFPRFWKCREFDSRIGGGFNLYPKTSVAYGAQLRDLTTWVKGCV